MNTFIEIFVVDYYDSDDDCVLFVENNNHKRIDTGDNNFYLRYVYNYEKLL